MRSKDVCSFHFLVSIIVIKRQCGKGRKVLLLIDFSFSLTCVLSVILDVVGNLELRFVPSSRPESPIKYAYGY